MTTKIKKETKVSFILDFSQGNDGRKGCKIVVDFISIRVQRNHVTNFHTARHYPEFFSLQSTPGKVLEKFLRHENFLLAVY